MVSYIIAIAILNYGLGVGLAEFVRWRQSVAARQKLHELEQAEQTQLSLDEFVVEEPEQIPSKWLDMLADEGIGVNSFVEAAAEVLRLEIADYRNQLVILEDALRGGEDGDDLRDTVQQLLELNRQWISQQSGVNDRVTSKSSDFGGYDLVGKQMQQTLVNQTAQLESSCGTLEALNLAEPEEATQRALKEINRQLDLAHVLRDRMHDVVAAILRTEERLSETESNARIDHLTGLDNRLGIECLFDEHRRANPAMESLGSAACVDLDRFGRINASHGTRVGDRVLLAITGLLRQVAEEDNITYSSARLAGQRFLLVFKEVGARNAMSACERIRQSLEATTLEYGPSEFEVTVSCGVTEWSKGNSTSDVIERALTAMQEAKNNGRNRTGLDDGDGPSVVDPPQYQVQGCVVRIEDQ